MDYVDLVKMFGEELVNKALYANALMVAESIEFSRKEYPFVPSVDYRERAIDRCIKLNISFQSTGNSHYNLCKKFIKMICPFCGAEMKIANGYGGSGANSAEYKCACGASAGISTPVEGISFSPAKK